MARFNINPLEEYVSRLNRLDKSKMQRIINETIYEGAKIVADEIKSELQNLQVSKKGITETEKKDLIDGFGISPMQTTDKDTNVKIGFAGYGSKPTKKYPKGVPNAMVARGILSGTQFRTKNPFVRRAVNRVKKKAVEKMNEVSNEKIKEEMN